MTTPDPTAPTPERWTGLHTDGLPFHPMQNHPDDDPKDPARRLVCRYCGKGAMETGGRGCDKAPMPEPVTAPTPDAALVERLREAVCGGCGRPAVMHVRAADNETRLIQNGCPHDIEEALAPTVATIRDAAVAEAVGRVEGRDSDSAASTAPLADERGEVGLGGRDVSERLSEALRARDVFRELAIRREAERNQARERLEVVGRIAGWWITNVKPEAPEGYHLACHEHAEHVRAALNPEAAQ